MADDGDGGGEFDFIAEHLAPLARDFPGAFGLLDDAACLESSANEDLVVTADALVEGVHFLAGTPYDLVARKALRANISDLAAKGARPFAYLLSIAWPQGTRRDDMAAFARGLAADQAAFRMSLIGGDTVATPGPLSISITAFGTCRRGGMVLRSTARVGDRVYVTGTIGAAALGLDVARGGLRDLPEEVRAGLRARHQTPQPRLFLAHGGASWATAAIDVSDGLMADASHLAAASGVAIDIEASAIPLSPHVREWLARQDDRSTARRRLATGGDDYEIVFTAAQEAEDALQSAAQGLGETITAIGRAEEGGGVRLLDEDGQPIQIEQLGFTHF